MARTEGDPPRTIHGVESLAYIDSLSGVGLGGKGRKLVVKSRLHASTKYRNRELKVWW
jgi:hypothetical protein